MATNIFEHLVEYTMYGEDTVDCTEEQILQYISNRIDNGDFTGEPKDAEVKEEGAEMVTWQEDFKQWLAEQAE